MLSIKPVLFDFNFCSFFCQSYIMNGVPLEDFGHGHPDPNLT